MQELLRCWGFKGLPRPRVALFSLRASREKRARNWAKRKLRCGTSLDDHEEVSRAARIFTPTRFSHTPTKVNEILLN